jgi:hypothetical protein
MCTGCSSKTYYYRLPTSNNRQKNWVDRENASPALRRRPPYPRSNRTQPTTTTTTTMPPLPLLRRLRFTNWKRLQKTYIHIHTHTHTHTYIYIHNIVVYTRARAHTHTRFNVTHRKMSRGPRPLSARYYTPRSDGRLPVYAHCTHTHHKYTLTYIININNIPTRNNIISAAYRAQCAHTVVVYLERVKL